MSYLRWHDLCQSRLETNPFRSCGDTNPQVSSLDDILPREPVVTVVNIPQQQQQQPLTLNETDQRKDSCSGIISQNGAAQRNSEISHASLSETLESELVQKWQRKLGSKYQIIVSSSTDNKTKYWAAPTWRWWGCPLRWASVIEIKIVLNNLRPKW